MALADDLASQLAPKRCQVKANLEASSLCCMVCLDARITVQQGLVHSVFCTDGMQG